MPLHPDEILARLTIDEKIDLLSGRGMWKSQGYPHYGVDAFIMTDGAQGVRYSVSQIDRGEGLNIEPFIPDTPPSAADAAAGAAATPASRSDAGHAIENMFGAARPATCFPGGACIACSWDAALFRRLGAALAEECHEMGVGLLLGPGLNIRRTPLAGRGYEYYSEDPLLSGELAGELAAALQREGIGACLKHFACNNSEYMRMEMDSVVDVRALREIYLAGFKRAIDKGKPWAVMSSYNLVNGVRASQNAWLLTTVLREEWGFDGLVVSDWHAVMDRPASLAAGNDVSMPERKLEKAALADAVRAGRLPEAALDASCRRMIRLARRIADGKRRGVEADYAAHHRLAQDIAAESVVLLKNNGGLLPLTPEKAKRIAVLGLPAQEPVIQGSGCSTTMPYLWDIPLDEIYHLAGEECRIDYAAGAPHGYETDAAELRKAVDAAARADAAVVFVSTGVGEDGESSDRANLDILPTHAELIRAAGAAQPNTIVVVANSDAVVMPWRDSAAAILETFYAGQGMGGAVARILFGQANPCGKLSVTFPRALEETPAFLTYPGENRRHLYGEGIHVGYRYYDARGIEPAFPFGFGLGYSRFDYDDLRLSPGLLRPGGVCEATAGVTNAGGVPGKEIVQLYVAPPPGRFRRERQALKAFAKVFIPAGERRDVALRFAWDDLAYFDPERGEWVVDPGVYGVRVGRSSRDIALEGALRVEAPVRFPRVREDSMAVLLAENPPALDRVARLVADKTGADAGQVREWLLRMAPNFFTGLYATLRETMNVDISRAELADALEERE